MPWADFLVGEGQRAVWAELVRHFLTNTGGDKAEMLRVEDGLGVGARGDERVRMAARIAKMPKKVKRSQSCVLESAT